MHYFYYLKLKNYLQYIQNTDIQIIFKTQNTTYNLLQVIQKTEHYENDGGKF
jgi:hypothetical protein